MAKITANMKAAIFGMTTEELNDIIDIVRAARELNASVVKNSIYTGSEVAFMQRGSKYEGIVTKVNRKTANVTVHTIAQRKLDDTQQWIVRLSSIM